MRKWTWNAEQFFGTVDNLEAERGTEWLEQWLRKVPQQSLRLSDARTLHMRSSWNSAGYCNACGYKGQAWEASRQWNNWWLQKSVKEGFQPRILYSALIKHESRTVLTLAGTKRRNERRMKNRGIGKHGSSHRREGKGVARCRWWPPPPHSQAPARVLPARLQQEPVRCRALQGKHRNWWGLWSALPL